MAVPSKLRLFNLHIEGKGYAGVVTSITPPNLEKITEDHRAGGMNTGIKIDLGTEPMDFTFVLAECDPDVLKLWGVVDHAGVRLSIKGSEQRDDMDAQIRPIEYELGGRWTAVDKGEMKPGEGNTMTVTVAVAYYKHSINSEVITEIDAEGCVEIVNGVDLMAEHRKNIGL